MEKGMDWEQKSLFNEITQGKDLAKQLQNHLHPSSSAEMRLHLVEKILCSYEKALSMLINSSAFSETKFGSISMLDSPPSAANGTVAASNRKDVSQKGKTMLTWTENVRVCTGSLEGPPEDGHCWRKYGQKDILGAKFPRGYYRCTHRHSQGCLATKQVQRSDSDPTIFEVRYRGTHICKQSLDLVTAEPPVGAASKENPEQSEAVGFNNGTETKVKRQELDSKDEIFPLFSFPYASVESEEGRNNMFSESMVEYNIKGRLSPAFIPPASTESNYFSMSPCHMGSFGIGQASEYDLTQIVPGAALANHSPIEGLDFSAEFDTNFSFDCFS